MKDFIKIADSIPSLGNGGKAIGDYLVNKIKDVPDNGTIVEVGPWLGSATAYLCAGIKESGKNINLHCFDMWQATRTYKVRAEKYHGIIFQKEEDILPHFRKNLKPFDMEIKTYKGAFKDVKKWQGGPIDLMIYDAGCSISDNNTIMTVFAKHFKPGITELIMMDYYFCNSENKKNVCLFYTAKYLMDKNKKHFEFKERLGNSMSATFKYLSGKPQIITDEEIKARFEKENK